MYIYAHVYICTCTYIYVCVCIHACQLGFSYDQWPCQRRRFDPAAPKTYCMPTFLSSISARNAKPNFYAAITRRQPRAY